MNFEGIKQLATKAGLILKQQSPNILTGIAVAGVVSTVAAAVWGTVRALPLVEEAEENRCYEDKEPLSKVDVVKITWKCYVPTAVFGAVTISSIIAANSINASRNAALAGAYSLTEAAFKEYKEKTTELLGPKKEEEIRDEIAKDTIKHNPVNTKNIIVMGGKGDTLCYEKYTGRYFYSSIEELRKAENELNRLLMSEMWLPLNDVYYTIGLSDTKVGESVGWDVCTRFEFTFSAQLTEDDVPCIVVDFANSPKPFDVGI